MTKNTNWDKINSECNITVIKAQNVKSLISLAVSRSPVLLTK